MNRSPAKFLMHKPRKETGIVLLLCLLLLTTLALLGLSASAETVVQDMLANNLQDKQQARQSALAAQQWAENWLLGLGGAEPVGCQPPCQGLLIHATGSLPDQPESEDLSWWMANGHEAGIDPLSGERLAAFSANSISPPMWLIELVHHAPASENGTGDDQARYRILVRGSGRTETTVSVIESIVSRPWRIGSPAGDTGAVQPGRCPGFNPTIQCQRIAWRALR